MATLPYELCEAIFDHLAPRRREKPAENLESLRNCALVSKDFAVLSQKRIFRYILLRRPHRISSQRPTYTAPQRTRVYPANQLFDLISTSPYIRRLIEDLEISDDEDMAFYSESSSWIHKDKVLDKIIPLLNNLKGLIITGNHKRRRLRFNAFTKETQNAIMSACASQLVRLSLNSVAFFPEITLRAMAKIEVIRLRNANFLAYPQHQSTSASSELEEANPETQRSLDRASSPHLTELILNEATTGNYQPVISPWKAVLECGIDLSRLRHLTLHVQPQIWETSSNSESFNRIVGRALKGSSHSLEFLTVILPYYAEQPDGQKCAIELQNMRSLRYLFLRTGILLGRAQILTAIRDLTHHLSSIPREHVWRYKSIKIEVLIEASFIQDLEPLTKVPELEALATTYENLAKAAEEENARRGEPCLLELTVGGDFGSRKPEKACQDGLVIRFQDHSSQLYKYARNRTFEA